MSMHGLRKSMLIGSRRLAGDPIAAIVGSFAAYFGGWFERISLWVIDLLLVLPGVPDHRDLHAAATWIAGTG